MSKENNRTRIADLEADVAKLREEAETTRKENALQFEEILKAINDLSAAVGNLVSKKESKQLEPKESPTNEIGSFLHSDEEENLEDEGSQGLGKTGKGCKNIDNGLEKELRSSVKDMQPEGQTRVMKLAIMIDENGANGDETENYGELGDDPLFQQYSVLPRFPP